MIPFKEYIKGPLGLPSLLRYFAFVDEGVLLHHDGSLSGSFYYAGPDMESSLGADEDALAGHVNRLLLRFGSEWAIQVDLLRVPSQEYPRTNAFNNTTSRLLETQRREAYEKEGGHFENIYAMTLTWMPSVMDDRRLAAVFIKTRDRAPAHDLAYQVRMFNAKLNEFMDFLSSKLDLHRMTSAEMMTFLHKCLSGEGAPVPLPEVPVFINHYAGAHEFVGGHAPRIDDKHIGIVTFSAFPASDISGAMNILSGLSFEYRYSSRFLFLDPIHAQNILKEYENKHAANKYSVGQMVAGALGHDPRHHPDAANRAVLTYIEEIKTAQHLLGLGDVSFGYYTGTVTVMDRDPGGCEEKVKFIRRLLNNNGYQSIEERMNAVDAFLGSLPGETIRNVRKPLVSTQNLANMMPLTDVWTGLAHNPCPYYPQGSPPLFYAATQGTTPFRFNLHTHDVGHTLVLGPTGGGKSVLLSHIGHSALRYPGAQVFFFDRGYSQFALTHAVNGVFYDILSDSQALSFCPLARINEQREQIWASEWVERLVRLQGLEVSPQIRSDIDQAIRETAKTPSRTLSALFFNMQNKAVQEALTQYLEVKEGYMAALLDAREDGLARSFWQTFEIARLMSMDPRRTTPVLLYLFHQIERSLDGRPTFVIIDEGWMIMMNELFMDFWIEFLRTARKNNACIILATQSLSDVVKSPSFSVINESCPTKIFLPNPSARDPDCQGHYEAFGLNARQIEIISEAQSKRQYYVTARDLGERLIDLGLGPLELAFYGIGASAGDRDMIRDLQSRNKDQWVSAWLSSRGLREEAAAWMSLHSRHSP